MKKSLKITIGVIGVIILLFVIDLICIFTIERPILAIRKEHGKIYRGLLYDTYKCQEYTLPQIKAKGTKFMCVDSKNNSNKTTEENAEHTFFGKVIETYSTHIIVTPNENEEESKVSDKFSIELGKNNDQVYNIGTNVKVTYKGGIKESYPAQINTTKIEIKSTDSFKLTFNSTTGNEINKIIDKNTSEKYNYNVYVWNGDITVTIADKTYPLKEALEENKITIEEIIADASQNTQNQIHYKDGGSIEYHCNIYTIIKFHTIEGNRDVYFGNASLKLEDIK